jgi:hypothetical protein
MSKKPLSVEQGLILDNNAAARPYNEKDEGLLYNVNNQKIRVQIEGIDREVLNDTQVQTVQNKALDNTNSIVVKDSNLTLQDNVDSTKQVNFELSVVSPSTNLVFTFPNSNGTLVVENLAQTFTGKVIDADINTISNLEVDNLKVGVLDVVLDIGSTDLMIPSAKASKDYSDSVSGAVNTSLGNHISNITDAHDASAISNIPSGNLAATDQQSVNNELQSDIDTRAVNSTVVHITGNESIAGIKTFSDITQSTTKDDGAVVIEGGLGIEKNVNIGGDVVITGGLQVNGTTTYVNTTNLQVKDANVVLNKGGNKAAADSADAGLTVEITDGTNAVIGYDSTLASRFMCGEAGSLKEIADVSSIQTLSNKKLSDSTTKIVDATDTTKVLAFDVAGTTGVTTTLVTSSTVNRTITLPDSSSTLTTEAFATAQAIKYSIIFG